VTVERDMNAMTSVAAAISGALISDPQAAVRFMLAGDAHLTFRSEKTGTRFTYHVRLAPNDGRAPVHFVSVLTAPDHYEYLGVVRNGWQYSHGTRSRVSTAAPSAVAFAWVWKRLSAGQTHPSLSVYHEGRCGRCGRRLTVPESILSGLGPECARKAGT
jgi:uncharacterized protein DUF6011